MSKRLMAIPVRVAKQTSSPDDSVLQQVRGHLNFSKLLKLVNTYLSVIIFKSVKGSFSSNISVKMCKKLKKLQEIVTISQENMEHLVVTVQISLID